MTHGDGILGKVATRARVGESLRTRRHHPSPVTDGVVNAGGVEVGFAPNSPHLQTPTSASSSETSQHRDFSGQRVRPARQGPSRGDSKGKSGDGMTSFFGAPPTRDTTLESKTAADPTGHKMPSLVGSDPAASDAVAEAPDDPSPDPMFTAMQCSAAEGLAWCDRHPDDGPKIIGNGAPHHKAPSASSRTSVRDASEAPTPTSPPSAASRHVVAGVRAALVGWLPKQRRR
jgi:hypothetical protein